MYGTFFNCRLDHRQQFFPAFLNEFRCNDHEASSFHREITKNGREVHLNAKIVYLEILSNTLLLSSVENQEEQKIACSKAQRLNREKLLRNSTIEVDWDRKLNVRHTLTSLCALRPILLVLHSTVFTIMRIQPSPVGRLNRNRPMGDGCIRRLRLNAPTFKNGIFAHGTHHRRSSPSPLIECSRFLLDKSPKVLAKILPPIYPEKEAFAHHTLSHGPQFGGPGSEKNVLLALLDQFAYSPAGGRSHPTSPISVYYSGWPSAGPTTMPSVSSSHPHPSGKKR